MNAPPTTTWRVSAYNPAANEATIDSFATEDEARKFAGILKGRRPTWQIDIHPTHVHSRR